jgi:hypothetical protein
VATPLGLEGHREAPREGHAGRVPLDPREAALDSDCRASRFDLDMGKITGFLEFDREKVHKETGRQRA